MPDQRSSKAPLKLSCYAQRQERSPVPSNIAVIVAAHNAERTIQKAVDSVLSGTQICDVFVVDDASRTPVAEILGNLGDRVHVMRLPQNGGPAAARNAALTSILRQSYKYVAIM